ncbi:unnamed protein product, partial [Prorocentrum cordatum]
YAGAPLWHQRRVWGRVIQDPTDARWSPLRVLISTPDGDVYEELYDMSDGTLAAVRFEDDRRTRPAGLEVGNLYRFRRALTAAEEVAIRNEVDAYARDVFLDAERAAGRPRVVPPAGAAVYFTFAAAAGGAVAPGPAPAAPAAGGGAAVAAALAVVPAGPAAPAAGPPAGAAPVAAAAAPLAAAGAPAGPLGPNAVPGADGQWVYVETTTTARRGDPVTLDGTELVRGAIGLKQDAGGSWSAIRLITTSQVAYRGAEALADARLQPVALLSDGSRQRMQFHESVDRLREEPFPDWPLDGPRTTLWCLRFLDRKRGGAIEHFHQFVSYYRLSRDDFGVTHYESIMRMVDYLMTWDLLDLPNVVGVEVMLRQAQLYEYMYAMEYEARDSGVSTAASAEGEPKGASRIWPPALQMYMRRLHRTSHRREMVVDAIRAMNEMYTGSSCPRPTGLTGPATAQQEALAVIQEAVDAFGVPPPDLTPAGALEELRVAQSYDQESAVIAPVTFDRVDLISLPSVGSEPKSLSALIGDDSMSIGHRLQELLLPRERGLARVAEHAPKRAYSDPNLRPERVLVDRLPAPVVDSGVVHTEYVDNFVALSLLLLPVRSIIICVLWGCLLTGWRAEWAGRLLAGTVPDGPEVSDVDPSFEEVPPDIWRDHWHPVLSVPWRRPAPQVILEARSGVMALKHKLRSKRSFRKAHVMLNDAMAPILALAKGRSSAPALLAVCRQVACLLLASGSAAHWRWLPSEFNSADPASRNRPGARRPAAAPAAPAPAHLGRRSRSQSAAALSWGDQADRRVARRRAFPAANTAATSGSLTFLETQAVGEATRRDYADRVSKFTGWATSVRLPIGEVPELDVALVTFFNQLFFDGYPSEEATKYMAALAHCRAAPGRLQVAFPRAARAAKGWARLVPPRSRLPLPWPIACLMIDWMLDAGETTAAAATAVCFALYLRPAELLSLTREQVIPPAEGAPPGRTFLNFWSVVLRPMECAQPSKTGVYDEGLLLDSPEFTWLPPLLQALRARAAPGGLVFDMSYNQWALVFRRAATALHLGVLGPPSLCTLRHGGASHEYLAKFRSLDEIKKRGRWVSDSSLRRYTKGGRVAEQMRRLPISEQRRATRLVDTIGGRLSNIWLGL